MHINTNTMPANTNFALKHTDSAYAWTYVISGNSKLNTGMESINGMDGLDVITVR